MNTVYIFDVDGTLTPSRQPMDKDFKFWFLTFIETHRVCLASGSDYIKTLEQVGTDVCDKVEAVYSCNGNDIWEHGSNMFRSNWVVPGELEQFLWTLLQHSEYTTRTGNHIERRPGQLNFSIVGRNANNKERYDYVQWDEAKHERRELAGLIKYKFPDLYAVVGGEISIDIGPNNTDKRQIATYFLPDEYIMFFGDKTESGGNDYPLAQSIVKYNQGITIPVRNWKDTWKYLLTALP